ncbi:hypothetical protein O9H85_20015 [Paenibacillus filicis]|uniref:Uncharacterized protein n=1 Tax=Paenibacillus gyeongsangnamensis TaxID=3388067 RepID=A0ABT4QCQ8_9BACL|nr:hypothetical protein [Paenibacillus filicis]MCZ8514669.1 hypothetical protein [Paenibacillus filicis]
MRRVKEKAGNWYEDFQKLVGIDQELVGIDQELEIAQELDKS